MIKDRIYPILLCILLSISLFFQGMYTESGERTVIFLFMIAVAVIFSYAVVTGSVSLRPASMMDWFVVSCIIVYAISSFTSVSLSVTI